MSSTKEETRNRGLGERERHRRLRKGKGEKRLETSTGISADRGTERNNDDEQTSMSQNRHALE